VPEYINHNLHTVHLTGPDGKIVKVKAKRKIILSEYFDKYRSRGFIKIIGEQQQGFKQRPQSQNDIQSRLKLTKPKGKRLVVGRRLAIDATTMLHDNLDKDCFPVSNNIGVGILSYNRPKSLKRLIESISDHTDLQKTTIFISDDASTNQELIKYLEVLMKLPHFVVIRNIHRGGVAVNTNRLIRCLSRFQHGLILNDDVQVLKNNWEYLYVDAMRKTGIHHFIYRQDGVYGAKLGDSTQLNGISLRKIDKRPQGAVLAFSREMLVRAGYFDEDYGLYGMEHVDWSMKAWETKLQPVGFFDVDGSEDYFKLHKDGSVVENRSKLLKDARKKFENRVIKRCGPTEKSQIPEITYVIPFRNIKRDESILTVVKNIRAQKFPVVHIILVEQDKSSKIELDKYQPISYHIAKETRGGKYELFNKSKAFNLGVSKSLSPHVVLHDADIIVQGNYTQTVWEVLQSYESCHLGKTVIYASDVSTIDMNKTGEITKKCQCDRVVGYFEGGSIACSTDAYWKIGGFNEDFWGYGVEDCDFYARLFKNSVWKENRVFDFLHLWHGRIVNWHDHHNVNKDIGIKLKSLPMHKRVLLQHQQLCKNGYSTHLNGVLNNDKTD